MAHGGRDMGTDTELRRPGFLSSGPDQAPVGRSKVAGAPKYGDRHDVRGPNMGTDTMSDILVRNVQRETFNSQVSTG